MRVRSSRVALQAACKQRGVSTESATVCVRGAGGGNWDGELKGSTEPRVFLSLLQGLRLMLTFVKSRSPLACMRVSERSLDVVSSVRWSGRTGFSIEHGAQDFKP